MRRRFSSTHQFTWAKNDRSANRLSVNGQLVTLLASRWAYDVAVLFLALMVWTEIFPYLRYHPGHEFSAIMAGLRYGLSSYMGPMLVYFALANAVRYYLIGGGGAATECRPNKPPRMPVSGTPAAASSAEATEAKRQPSCQP